MKDKPKVVWEAMDADGKRRRVVAMPTVERNGKPTPWHIAEKEGADALGRKIWVPWDQRY